MKDSQGRGGQEHVKVDSAVSSSVHSSPSPRRLRTKISGLPDQTLISWVDSGVRTFFLRGENEEKVTGMGASDTCIILLIKCVDSTLSTPPVTLTFNTH